MYSNDSSIRSELYDDDEFYIVTLNSKVFARKKIGGWVNASSFKFLLHRSYNHFLTEIEGHSNKYVIDKGSAPIYLKGIWLRLETARDLARKYSIDKELRLLLGFDRVTKVKYGGLDFYEFFFIYDKQRYFRVLRKCENPADGDLINIDTIANVHSALHHEIRPNEKLKKNLWKEFVEKSFKVVVTHYNQNPIIGGKWVLITQIFSTLKELGVVEYLEPIINFEKIPRIRLDEQVRFKVYNNKLEHAYKKHFKLPPQVLLGKKKRKDYHGFPLDFKPLNEKLLTFVERKSGSKITVSALTKSLKYPGKENTKVKVFMVYRRLSDGFVSILPLISAATCFKLESLYFDLDALESSYVQVEYLLYYRDLLCLCDTRYVYMEGTKRVLNGKWCSIEDAMDILDKINLPSEENVIAKFLQDDDKVFKLSETREKSSDNSNNDYEIDDDETSESNDERPKKQRSIKPNSTKLIGSNGANGAIRRRAEEMVIDMSYYPEGINKRRKSSMQDLLKKNLNNAKSKSTSSGQRSDSDDELKKTSAGKNGGPKKRDQAKGSPNKTSKADRTASSESSKNLKNISNNPRSRMQRTKVVESESETENTQGSEIGADQEASYAPTKAGSRTQALNERAHPGRPKYAAQKVTDYEEEGLELHEEDGNGVSFDPQYQVSYDYDVASDDDIVLLRPDKNVYSKSTEKNAGVNAESYEPVSEYKTNGKVNGQSRQNEFSDYSTNNESNGNLARKGQEAAAEEINIGAEPEVIDLETDSYNYSAKNYENPRETDSSKVAVSSGKSSREGVANTFKEDTPFGEGEVVDVLEKAKKIRSQVIECLDDLQKYDASLVSKIPPSSILTFEEAAALGTSADPSSGSRAHIKQFSVYLSKLAHHCASVKSIAAQHYDESDSSAPLLDACIKVSKYIYKIRRFQHKTYQLYEHFDVYSKLKTIHEQFEFIRPNIAVLLGGWEKAIGEQLTQHGLSLVRLKARKPLRQDFAPRKRAANSHVSETKVQEAEHKNKNVDNGSKYVRGTRASNFKPMNRYVPETRPNCFEALNAYVPKYPSTRNLPGSYMPKQPYGRAPNNYSNVNQIVNVYDSYVPPYRERNSYRSTKQQGLPKRDLVLSQQHDSLVSPRPCYEVTFDDQLVESLRNESKENVGKNEHIGNLGDMVKVQPDPSVENVEDFDFDTCDHSNGQEADAPAVLTPADVLELKNAHRELTNFYHSVDEESNSEGETHIVSEILKGNDDGKSEAGDNLASIQSKSLKTKEKFQKYGELSGLDMGQKHLGAQFMASFFEPMVDKNGEEVPLTLKALSFLNGKRKYVL